MARDRRTTIRNFVERAHGALDRVDYYRLLNLSSAATSEEVRAAYYHYAASLHPDMHGADVDPEYRKKLTAVFSRVAEAYKVLSSPDLRTRYDRELAGGKMRLGMGAEVAGSKQDITNASAKRFYELALAALKDGDRRSAVMNLRFALQQEPGNPVIGGLLEKTEKGEA